MLTGAVFQAYTYQSKGIKTFVKRKSMEEKSNTGTHPEILILNYLRCGQNKGGKIKSNYTLN